MNENRISSLGDYVMKAFAYAVLYFGISLLFNALFGTEESLTQVLLSSAMFGLFLPPTIQLMSRWDSQRKIEE